VISYADKFASSASNVVSAYRRTWPSSHTYLGLAAKTCSFPSSVTMPNLVALCRNIWAYGIGSQNMGWWVPAPWVGSVGVDSIRTSMFLFSYSHLAKFGSSVS